MLVLGLALLFVEQGREILLMLSDKPDALAAEGKSIWLRRLGFFGATFFWCVGTWYWAHFVLRFQNPWVNAAGEPAPKVRIAVPRFLGAMVFVGMAGALACAAFRVESANRVDPEAALIVLAIVCLVFAAVAYAVGRLWGRLATPAAAPIETLRSAGWMTWLVFGFYTAGFAALLVLAVVAPAAITEGVNSLVIFIVAISLWLPGTSLAAYGAMRWRVPFFLIFLIWIAAASFWNDAYEVRRAADDSSEAASLSVFARPNLSSTFETWVRQNLPRTAGETRPVVFVATAGGGLRAALWTINILGEIEAAAPEAYNRIFAISGVSGGAVGATIHTSIRFASPDKQSLACTSDAWFCAQKAMQEDFLAPSTLALVFPDVLRMLLPLRWPQLPDRAAALEKAWEVKWAEVMLGSTLRHDNPRNRLANGFLSLWPDGRAWPVLLLNSTSVETGKRVIISNVVVDGAQSLRMDSTDPGPVFPDTFDGLRILGRDMPASAAANLASRFPYVEPAARFTFDCRRLTSNGPNFISDLPDSLRRRCAGKDGKITWGRVVDGGYFENFGAATLSDVLRHLKPDLAEKRLLPIVIQISSDPDIDRIEGALADWDQPSQFAHQVVAPPAALANTRTARGIHALFELKRTARDVDAVFFHFRLCRVPGSRNPPLGWYMSIRAFNVLFKAREECGNKEALEVLRFCLKARTQRDVAQCRSQAAALPVYRPTASAKP